MHVCVPAYTGEDDYFSFEILRKLQYIMERINIPMKCDLNAFKGAGILLRYTLSIFTGVDLQVWARK